MAKTPDQVGKLLYHPSRARIWAGISDMQISEVSVCADVETVKGMERGGKRPAKNWTACPTGHSIGNGCFVSRVLGGEE